MEKTSGACQGIDCPGLNAGPKSLEHERRFLSGGSAGTAVSNSSEKSSGGAIERNPAK